ncbi:MAG: glycoside hydrolase family 65 protein, partial [Sphingobacteriaceae bacterium]
MKKIVTLLFVLKLFQIQLFAQSINPWKISAEKINPANYYGITVANGMIGIVSSPEPFRVKNVVLAGVYDQYGRGRVSNFLNSFNLLNMNLDINGSRLNAKS